jgi:sulfite reductase beta subunit-like hemoprotein
MPLGDASAEQFRRLADLVHKYASDHCRTTVEQNVVLRWVKNEHVPALYEDLKAIGLADSGAGTIVDVVACPGTDTCKLGIATCGSRSPAASTPAASTTSPTSASTATAETSAGSPCLTSR